MSFYSFDWGSIFYGEPEKEQKEICFCGDYTMQKDAFCLFFLLSGHGMVLTKEETSETLNFSSGHYITFYSSEDKFQYHSFSKSIVLKIKIALDFIHKVITTSGGMNKGYNIERIDSYVWTFIYKIMHHNKSKIYTTGIIFLLLLIIEKKRQQKEYRFSNRFNKKQIEDIKNYLEENMDNPPSFKQLCRMSNMPTAKFCHDFKRQTGVTPYMYLRKIRMQKALQLVQKSDFSITDISYELGYKNISYFSRIFFDSFGMLPSEMRKSEKYKCEKKE